MKILNIFKEIFSNDEKNNLNDPIANNWKQWVDNIEFVLSNLKRKGATISALKIDPPITAEELSSKQWYGTMEIDYEFKRIITEFAGNISFGWHFEDKTKQFDSINFGAYEESCMWNSLNYWSTSETIFEELGFEGGFYITLGITKGGDCIAIDMTSEGHPVILITHDGCTKDEAKEIPIGEMDYFQGKRLGYSFVDFMNRWTQLGCFIFEEKLIEYFYDYDNQCLLNSGEKINKWKQWLIT